MLNIINVVKKTSCLLLFCLYSFSVCSQSLNIGIIDYPPHINFDDDLEKSPLYQYINNMLLPLGLTVKFVKLPRERASLELIKGKVDMLMPISLENKAMKILSSPIFHSTPGLCFKKENFIPILSATHRFDDLTIGVPINASPVSALTDSAATLVYLKGKNATSRGIEMTQRGRFDAFYHPSPLKVYHRNNPLFKEVACSYFHGYSTPVYIAITNKMPADVYHLINMAYQKAITK